MTLRHAIVAMTLLAVISDAILIPFYPQFFAQRYGTTSAVHAGAYVAAISIAVMTTLPCWARITRHIDAMHLLVFTQFAAGVLSLASYWAPSLWTYWVLSLLMFACKSSYLLMYPYLMRRELPGDQRRTIGLLSVVVHFGAILGAIASGAVIEAWGVRICIVAMAAGDLGQMLVCLHLIRRHAIARRPERGTQAVSAIAPRRGWREIRPVLRLSLLMLTFDLGAYLVRPFFSSYWQTVAASQNEAATGLAFAIPGFVAVAALWIDSRTARRRSRAPDPTVANLMLGAAGLVLHGSGDPLWIVVGRCLYGWALFKVTVRLDVALFAVSTRDAYAADYSIANFFQNLGVLLASFAAGALVDEYGLGAPFHAAAAGFLLTAWLVPLLLPTAAGNADGGGPAGGMRTSGEPSLESAGIHAN